MCTSFSFVDLSNMKNQPVTCFFLTPEMVVAENKRIFEEEENPTVKEALLTINNHVLCLLQKGKTITKDINGSLKLWEEKRA